MKTILIIIFVGGVLFGAGLAFSTMVKPEVVLDFLTFEDFGLALVMAAALAVAMPIYQFAPRLMRRPMAGSAFKRAHRRIVPATVLGGAVFGVGWGLCGVCPGAGIASLGVGNWPIVFALAGMLIGAYVQGLVSSRRSAARWDESSNPTTSPP